MTLQNTSNKLSRRNWLYNAAIAATSTAILPSLLTGCTDHTISPGAEEGNPGNGLLTGPELERARQNLINMIHFTDSVKLYTTDYEEKVWGLLQSGKKPASYDNFIQAAILKVIEVLLMAALSEVPGAPVIVGAVFGLVNDFIKTWESENARPPGLASAYATIGLAMDKNQKAISDELNRLAEPKDNYRNLREAWQGEIKFNGKTYTLKDLVTADFPTEGHVDFVNLRTAAVTRYHQIIWSLLMVKAGNINVDSFYKQEEANYTPTEYARDEFYREHKAAYLRGYYKQGYFYYRDWHFNVDGLELSDDAAKVLFKDDTPGHIIRPDALFARDYVFKQFQRKKLDFTGYHELRKDSSMNEKDRGTSWWGFDGENKTDDYDFTGGIIDV